MSIDQYDASQPAPDQVRAHLHGMWETVADAWGQHAAFVDARLAGVTRRMLDGAGVRPGDRVLELACGAGGVGLAAAQRVGPEDRIVLSDVAVAMTTVAGQRAATLGLGQVDTRVLDLERIDQPDHSFDVVLCRDGLQFAANPAQAASEIRRVLAPGGRAAIAVWGPRERNPWLGLALHVVSTQLGRPGPGPGMPGPFSLPDPAALAGLLRSAGLADVSADALPAPMSVASFDEWWHRTTALAGPLASLVRDLSPAAVSALCEAARDAARPYETRDGYTFPGLAIVAIGHV
jgi:SAM-dependent methyltransferase